MVNTEAMLSLIRERGYKMSHLAKLLGICPNSLYRKTRNMTEFKSSEVEVLCKALGVNSLSQRKALFCSSGVDKMAN